MEQETLEEVAERKFENIGDRLIFEDGAKWQQERSCSKEEVNKLLDIVLVNPSHITILKKGYGQFDDTYEITEKGVDYIIEQFKKK